MFKRATLFVAIGISFIILAAEAAFRLAGSDEIPSHLFGCVVLVPGYPTRSDGTPHAIQQFRVEAGVAAFRKFQCSRIIFSGGAVDNKYAEADTMASIAESLGVSSNDRITERRARSTWENVGCSKPYFKDDVQVLIVSDTLHARRAKKYACRQDSRHCSSVSAIGSTPPLTALWWAIPLAANEIRAKIKDYLAERFGHPQNAPACSASDNR